MKQEEKAHEKTIQKTDGFHTFGSIVILCAACCVRRGEAKRSIINSYRDKIESITDKWVSEIEKKPDDLQKELAVMGMRINGRTEVISSKRSASKNMKEMSLRVNRSSYARSGF